MNPSPELVSALGQIGGALLVVIGLLFLFLFGVLGLLVRRMDRMGDRIGRMVAEINAAHAEELRQAFAMMGVLLDQHLTATHDALRDARAPRPGPPPAPSFGADPED